MKITEAVKLLRQHQKWRNGAEIIQIKPYVLTQAINVILKNFEERYTKQDFLNAAEAGEVSMIDAKHIVSLLDEIKNSNKE
jgi:hypothetical protein